MNIQELNQTLIAEARKNGLCDEWYGRWNDDKTQDDLVQMMIDGIDFTIDHPRWISNEFIKSNFDNSILLQHNLFIDYNEDKMVTNGNGIYVIQGASNGVFKFDWYDAATLHVRQASDIDVYAEGRSHIFIHVYESATVRVHQDDVANVYVYKHGNKCEVETEGDVFVRKSNVLAD